MSICFDASSRYGIVSLGCRRCRGVEACIYNSLVGRRRRARKSSIDRVQSINAPDVGEDSHFEVIESVLKAV